VCVCVCACVRVCVNWCDCVCAFSHSSVCDQETLRFLACVKNNRLCARHPACVASRPSSHRSKSLLRVDVRRRTVCLCTRRREQCHTGIADPGRSCCLQGARLRPTLRITVKCLRFQSETQYFSTVCLAGDATTSMFKGIFHNCDLRFFGADCNSSQTISILASTECLAESATPPR
jgi:hypothetical protein